MVTTSFESRLIARIQRACVAAILAASVSCTLQEPVVTDPLDPPDATADTLAISPQNASVATGDSITFAAPGETVVGTPVSGPVEWTVSGGTGASVTSAGTFRASAGGDYVVQAARAGHSGRSRVHVSGSSSALSSVRIAPNVLTLQPGAAFTLAVSGLLPDGTVVPVSGNWTATGGTITSGGRYTAGSALGTFRVVVTQQGGTLADTSAITISSAAPTLTAIELSPPTVSLLPSASQQFSAIARMSDGSTGTASIAWSATGGTISSSGLYQAGATTGTFRVVAAQQGGTKADTAVVTITAPPPTLQAIEVSPGSVSLAPSASQQFSAVGRMSNGTSSSVTVSWSATGGTITSTGAYVAGSIAGTFRVIAAQQGGAKADTANVTITAVTPPPTVTLQAVVVSPVNASLETGDTQQFSAAGRMSDGSTSSLAVAWSATGGSISSAGLYTAGSTAGNYSVVARQQGGTLADTSLVTVTVPAPTLQAIVISPASIALTTGASQQFSATGRMSDGSTGSVSVTYSATGGSVNAAGLFTAGTVAGSYRVIAVQQGGSKADTAAVTIAVPAPTLSAIEISPGSVSLVTGGSQQFSAVGRMSDGSTASIPISWNATGGTVSSSGAYVAGNTTGTFRVIAGQQGGTRADTSAVTITAPAPTFTAVEVTPATATVAAGATQQFSAIGRMSDGSTSSVAVTWSATGGTVSGTGLYTAGATAGTYRVIAVRQGDTKADTSAVTITVAATPTLSAVEVTPGSASVGTGGTQQFSALGRMSDNSTSAVTVTWSATGGTISTGGLYTAGSTAGAYRVIAVQQGGTRADTAAVTVTAPVTGGFTVTMPEGPRVVLNTAYTAPTGSSIAVAAGGNLQAALNGASCGDEVVLAAGATFTGNFVLPAKGCGASNRIHVRSAGTLPAEGQRMTPAQAGSLAKLVSANSTPALQTASAASGYRVMGVEITVSAGAGTNYGIVALGNGETTLSQVPTDLILDRVYIHGNPSQNVRRGVALNSRSTAIIDSYISEIHESGADNQAICGWTGPGPFKIENNYLAAAGQNIMFGGSDPSIANLSPSDIEIRHNHLFKPLAWQSQGWIVKNIVEFKHAQRVVVEGNVLENHWVGAQAGFAVVMFSVNQGQTAPWTVVQDILWRNNVLKNIPAGFNLAETNSHDNQIGQSARRIALVNNLLERVGESAVGGVGRMVQVLGDINGVADVTVEHNTMVFSTAGGATRNSFLMFSGPKAPRLTFRNNIAEMGSYGIIRVDDVGGSGTAGLNNSATPWQVLGNVFAGSTSGNAYPSGNPVAASTSVVGFSNASGSDYSLSASSSYRGQATDGTDPGYNRAALLTATQGVVLP